VEIRSKNKASTEWSDAKHIKATNKLNSTTGEITSKGIINPNNYGEGELFTLSEYEKVMKELTQKAGITDYQYNRIDIRFDSYIDNYREYFKLNSLFINLFMVVSTTFKNNEPTVSYGLRSRKKWSFFICNESMKIEYYDKKQEKVRKTTYFVK
jgi:hypothetical protein